MGGTNHLQVLGWSSKYGFPSVLQLGRWYCPWSFVASWCKAVYESSVVIFLCGKKTGEKKCLETWGDLKITLQKLTWKCKIRHLNMYFLLKMVIFQCHVSFQGCTDQLKCQKPKKKTTCVQVPIRGICDRSDPGILVTWIWEPSVPKQGISSVNNKASRRDTGLMII